MLPCTLTAAEEEKSQKIKMFVLNLTQDEARIWPWLAYLFQVHPTAVPAPYLMWKVFLFLPTGATCCDTAKKSAVTRALLGTETVGDVLTR